ncbi:hypothetical protein ACWDCB_45250 [Streptomyces sp. NPDC001178]
MRRYSAQCGAWVWHRVCRRLSRCTGLSKRVLLRCRAHVAAEGPIAVADSTEDLVEAASDCRDVLTALASLPGASPETQAMSRAELVELCRQGAESLAASLAVFVGEAREALDDNGAP